MKFIQAKNNQISSYYHERPNSPTYLSVIFPAGTVHESTEKFGISHLIEHLICRETTKYDSLQSLKAEIAKRGLYVNAHTSLDHTRLHIGIPMSEDFGFAIGLLKEMLYSPRYSSETIEIEKNAIRSEMAVLSSNPGRYIYSELYRKLFGLEVSDIPNYGNLKNLDSFTDKDVDQQFAHIKSLPITVLASGGVSLRDFQRGIASMPSFNVDSTSNDKVLEAVSSFASAEIEHGDRLSVGYIYASSVVGLDSLCAIDLLTEYLGNYMFGVLTQKLRDESGDSYYVDAGHSVYGKNGYVSISTDIKKSDKAQLNKVIFSEISRLADGEIDVDRLEIVREMLIKRSPVKLEQTSSEVIVNERLKSFIVNSGNDYSNYLDQLKGLDIDQIRKFAHQVFKLVDSSG